MKNGVELLAECCKTDDAVLKDADTSTVISEAQVELTSISDLDENIPMDPAMIPVIQKGDYYYVDFSGVQAVAMDMGADIGQIMNAILAANSDGDKNNLTPENTILTIESADYFNELIEEAKYGGKLGEKAKLTLAKATETIKGLNRAGIKVVKKKSRK